MKIQKIMQGVVKIVDRLYKNLDRLKRNEQNMTPALREKHKGALRMLRLEIAEDATLIAHHFLLDALVVPEADRAAFLKRCDEVLTGQGGITRVLFSTYSVERFIESLTPLWGRLMSEAYAPVWMAHCHRTGDPDYPFYSDLIQMYWESSTRMWVNIDGTAFTMGLPPFRR